MEPADLLDRLHEEPFKPFRIFHSDGSRMDVNDPLRILVGETSAVVPTAFVVDDEGYSLAKHCKTIAIDQILWLSDLS